MTGVQTCALPISYEAHGGLAGLRRALAMSPEEVVAEVTASGLRGRGGAGFPTGIKWETVRKAQAALKFVCVNADEGDSGTFADRMLMEGDPFSLVEGMVIAAYAVGASEGFIYVRSEYPHAVATLRRAIDIAYAHGVLGQSVLGSAHAFDLDVRVGAGAYICGEETSMLESLEGKRGEVRAKPPIPALSGLFGAPTVVNNVISMGSVPMILADGGEAYAAQGKQRSGAEPGAHQAHSGRSEPAQGQAPHGRTDDEGSDLDGDEQAAAARILADLGGANQRAADWCAEVNAAVHSEIAAVPQQRDQCMGAVGRRRLRVHPSAGARRGEVGADRSDRGDHDQAEGEPTSGAPPLADGGAHRSGAHVSVTAAVTVSAPAGAVWRRSASSRSAIIR